MSRAKTAETFFAPVSTADWGGRATRAEINLDVIEANVRALRRRAGDRELMAVVKANGYGHGAEAVAHTALSAGATRIAVYTVDEGVALRAAGIQAPVLVFGPFEPGEATAVVRYHLTPTIHSAAQAEALGAAAKGQTVPFHVKVDTGLTRAGLPPGDVFPFVEMLRTKSWLQAEGIYTHLACADEPASETTSMQLKRFREVLDILQTARMSFPLAHTSNSAGTLGVENDMGNLVRTGIAMYGYHPAPDLKAGAVLSPALALLSAVARVTTIESGAGVGYGHDFRALRRSRIALIPIGYGDGLHRTVGHGVTSVIVRGARAPIIGRVSMDQITADVTDIPAVEHGDTVTLIGGQASQVQTAADIAGAIGTISYEVLSSLQRRVPRLYTRGGRIVAASKYGEPPVPYPPGNDA